MGWYTCVKTINGRKYLYNQTTWREGGSVKCKSIYVGPVSGGDVVSTRPVEHSSLKSARRYASFDKVEAEVLMEMLELSRPGYRVINTDGSARGVSSTFPSWVPEHLRSMKLFEKVAAHIEKGIAPQYRATRQTELYEVVSERMLKQCTTNEAEIEEYIDRGSVT